MNYNNLQQYKDTVIGFVDFDTWRNPSALNLTFRQCIMPFPPYKFWLDEIAASRNVNHLFNILNAKLLARNERRHGGRIGSFAVIEHEVDKRLHCHALVECPDEAKLDYLEELVAARWPQTTWGYKQTVVKPCDKGWLDYMTKFRAKADYLSAHAWSSLNLPKKKDS